MFPTLESEGSLLKEELGERWREEYRSCGRTPILTRASSARSFAYLTTSESRNSQPEVAENSLWDLGSKPTLPVFSLPQPLRPLAPPPQTEAGPSRPRTPVTQATDSLEQLSVNPNETKPSATLTASDISTLLSLALLQVLSAETSPLPNFPIPSSQLYSAHVLPSRPAYIPKDQREDVVIGKSEWKKLAKWMKEAGKDGLLKIKESKGEVTVQGCVISYHSRPA